MCEQPAYLNPLCDVETRVSDLLSRMTLEEKVRQMAMTDLSPMIRNGVVSTDLLPGILDGLSSGCIVDSQSDPGLTSRRAAETFNLVQRYLVEKTRLGIPALVVAECLHGHRAAGATVFPQAIGLGSTWNPQLIHRMAEAAAKEARSVGVTQALAPDLDLARDPRWGRVEETYGEDPHLVTKMGEAYIRGMQGEGPMIDRDHLVCTVKHFAAHGSPESGINLGPVPGGLRELYSTYLPPFEHAVKIAGALSVMPAYSEYDGVPAHASKLLLTQILREEWGFKGYVFSDYGGVRMLHSFQHTASTVAEAGVHALRAGVDLEAPAAESFGDELLRLVKTGEVDINLIDQAAGRILRVKFLAGLFENPYVDALRAENIVNCDAHRQLAREIAVESIVLLKNEDAVLPLNAGMKCIAVLGPNSDVAQLGDYTIPKPGAISPLEGIRAAVPPGTEVLHAGGCSLFNRSTDGIPQAVEAARKADVAIVCVGGTSHFNAGIGWGDDHGIATCGEGFDLSDLSLTGVQEELIRAVHATGTPTIVVLIDGRPNAIPWIAENIPAILAAWYPGEQGGHALADIIFGRVNPSAKLPISFPRSTGHVPCFYNYKPSGRGFYKEPGSPTRAGRDYVFSSPEALFAFGHGLSYTTFEYSNLRIYPAAITNDSEVQIRVSVRNTGKRIGKEVVQLYLRDLYSSTATPVKSLKRFEKVELAPGQSAEIHFELGPDDLKLLDPEMKWRVEPGAFEVYVANLRGGFEVV